MAASTPTIQVLSKQNYEDQHIVALPDALPLPPLPPSSLRIQATSFSLTTNNFSYARFGHLLGWWDVHPLPPSIPKEFADPEEYGRISAWGYGVVTESTLSADAPIGVGARVWGYLPIGTLPVDMKVEVKQDEPGQFLEVSPQRASLMPIYNRYLFYPPINTVQDKVAQKQSDGYEDLVRIFFETGYLMNRFVLAYESSELVHPSKEFGPVDPAFEWTAEDAHVGNDTIVVLFAASSKTALGFAHNLKKARPQGKTAQKIVAVGSNASKAFTEGTKLYDLVLNYNDDSNGDLGERLGANTASKVIFVDFGARGGVFDRWAEQLKTSGKNLQTLFVGGEVVADGPEVVLRKFAQSAGKGRIQINASGMRSQALAKLGVKKYFEEFQKVWDSFKNNGGVRGLKLVWGSGMDDVGKGWEKLYKGEVPADEGLVFEV